MQQFWSYRLPQLGGGGTPPRPRTLQAASRRPHWPFTTTDLAPSELRRLFTIRRRYLAPPHPKGLSSLPSSSGEKGEGIPPLVSRQQRRLTDMTIQPRVICCKGVTLANPRWAYGQQLLLDPFAVPSLRSAYWVRKITKIKATQDRQILGDQHLPR